MKHIKRLIRESYALQKKVEELNSIIKTNLEQVQSHFDSEKIKELIAESESDGEVQLIAKRTDRVTVEYFPGKLEKNLSPEIFNEIINKTYTVTDMPSMIKLLRVHSVDPKAFKKLINIEQSVNRSEIKRLYDEGEITKDDIKGCFAAKVSKSIKISRVKDG